MAKRGRPRKPENANKKRYYVPVDQRQREPNPPWNPAPAQDIPVLSMFLECENGHMSYREEILKAPCKICGGKARSANG